MKIWRKRICDLLHELISDKGVCRTAPATPGLLTITNNNTFLGGHFDKENIDKKKSGLRGFKPGFHFCELPPPLDVAPPYKFFGRSFPVGLLGGVFLGFCQLVIKYFSMVLLRRSVEG